MIIKLKGGQKSADGPQTDGSFIVQKFRYSLLETDPITTGCEPVEVELVLKFKAVPGMSLPTPELENCKATLELTR